LVGENKPIEGGIGIWGANAVGMGSEKIWAMAEIN
jgi:hypothetical protein